MSGSVFPTRHLKPNHQSCIRFHSWFTLGHTGHDGHEVQDGGDEGMIS